METIVCATIYDGAILTTYSTGRKALSFIGDDMEIDVTDRRVVEVVS